MRFNTSRAAKKMVQANLEQQILQVSRESHYTYSVTNPSKGTSYEVMAQGDLAIACDCPAFKFSKHPCKHMEAVNDHIKKSSPVPSTAPASAPWQSEEVLPGIRLNQQQAIALKELEEFVLSDEQLYLLTGYAGVGKSVLLQVLIKHLRNQGINLSIVFTAFSNKATKVLSRMVDRWNLEVECLTCCKLLGLKPKINETTGKQEFIQDYDAENQIDRFNLVVVDEASMISEEMFELLTNQISLFSRTKLLFVGDIAQLPPVGERESRCFSDIYSRSDLTEVVRYGGAIGVLAESIRTRLDYKRLPEFETSTNDDRTEGVFALSLMAWEQAMLKAFRSDAWKQDPDYARVVAYTNERVGKLNHRIRGAIYGSDAPRFMEGERLMADSPVIMKDTVVLQTSSECKVLSIQEGSSGGWKVWMLYVQPDEGRSRTIMVLHENEHHRFEQKLKELSKAKRWREFWDMKQLFADMNYAYAMTIHKSQGSTFQNVFVDVQNALLNRNIRERNQLIYVAITRAAKRVFILN